MRKRRFAILRTLLAAVLSAGATLALLEIGLRYVPLRSYEWPVQQALPGLKQEIVYSRNPFGMRSQSMTTKAKPRDTVRILCLGASTTDQPTQNTEDTWSAYLERSLNARFATSGVRVEVAAYGRGGFRATHALDWAGENLESLEPDILITLLGINDLSWNGYPGYTYTRGRTSRTPSQSVFAFLRRHSRVVQSLEPIVQRYRHGSTLEWHSANLASLSAQLGRYPYMKALKRDPDPILEFEDSVASLLQLATRARIESVVLGQPVLWKAEMTEAERAVLWFPAWTQAGPTRVDPSELAREMERYNQTQRLLAADNHAHYIATDVLLPRTLENFFDDCHLTDRGSARLAEIIAPDVGELVSRIMDRNRSQ